MYGVAPCNSYILHIRHSACRAFITPWTLRGDQMNNIVGVHYGNREIRVLYHCLKWHF